MSADKKRVKALPDQASETAQSRAFGQRGTAKRSARAKGRGRPERVEQGAVVQGPTVAPPADTHEPKVTDPKLGSYEAIAEALD